MSNQFANLDTGEIGDRSQKPSEGLTRRQIVMGGAALAGLTTAVMAENAQANTQTPPEPKATTNPNGRFARKVVLITGATSGIGEATARAFAKEGAIVHFCGRREALGSKIAAEITAQGGRASYQQADVRREEEVEAFVNGCVQRYGRIDIAFNNAGAFVTAGRPIAEVPTDEFMNVIMTNIVGEFLSMKYELPIMERQGSGVIINMASVSGHKGFPQISPYSVSKHGVVGLTRCAALEYTPKNIRVVSISPGGVDTPMLRAAFKLFGTTPEQASQGVPIRRINTVEEMARAVMFLASDDATSFSASIVDVTGGMLI